MTSDRIKEIQQLTAHPDSVSVMLALKQVWNECEQEQNEKGEAERDWIRYDWNKIETRPTEYGKYLICRKDGKIHWETWNGSGWAYNNNVITYWMPLPKTPKQDRTCNNNCSDVCGECQVLPPKQ